MSISSRPYETESDYEAMRRLTADIIARNGLPSYASAGDLDWWRYSDDDPTEDVRGTSLWLTEDGTLVAFAWPTADQVDIFVHPDHPSLYGDALDWAEDHHRRKPSEGSRPPLKAWSFTADTTRIPLLQARDYQRMDKCMVYYVHDLATPPPGLNLPTGYSVTHVQAAEDVAQRVAVQRSAFQSEFMTVDKQRAVMAAPSYRAELDIAIRAPDGRFAAFALIWLDEGNRLGVFEPVGVAADQQRLGLGRAIMLAGLQRLHALGAHRAVVQTGMRNEAARALYEATGFTELDRCYAWTRADFEQPAD